MMIDGKVSDECEPSVVDQQINRKLKNSNRFDNNSNAVSGSYKTSTTTATHQVPNWVITVNLFGSKSTRKWQWRRRVCTRSPARSNTRAHVFVWAAFVCVRPDVQGPCLYAVLSNATTTVVAIACGIVWYMNRKWYTYCKTIVAEWRCLSCALRQWWQLLIRVHCVCLKPQVAAMRITHDGFGPKKSWEDDDFRRHTVARFVLRSIRIEGYSIYCDVGFVWATPNSVARWLDTLAVLSGNVSCWISPFVIHLLSGLRLVRLVSRILPHTSSHISTANISLEHFLSYSSFCVCVCLRNVQRNSVCTSHVRPASIRGDEQSKESGHTERRNAFV